MAIALIVNPAEVSTREAILRRVERKYGRKRRVWVFDRRMYLVGTPRSQMKQFEAELVAQENWTQVRPEVEVKKIAVPQGEKTHLLCRSGGRKEKERALRETAEGVRLFWQMKEDRKTWRESRQGAYRLRTNLQAQTAEAEAAFRALKSELSIWPLFH